MKSLWFAGTFHLIRAGAFGVIERRACGLQMALGEVKINRGGFDVRMSEQCLHGGQISAPFHQMGGEAVTQQMRRYSLGDAGTLPTALWP
jgi:hypothetical protein